MLLLLLLLLLLMVPLLSLLALVLLIGELLTLQLLSGELRTVIIVVHVAVMAWPRISTNGSEPSDWSTPPGFGSDMYRYMTRP